MFSFSTKVVVVVVAPPQFIDSLGTMQSSSVHCEEARRKGRIKLWGLPVPFPVRDCTISPLQLMGDVQVESSGLEMLPIEHPNVISDVSVFGGSSIMKSMVRSLHNFTLLQTPSRFLGSHSLAEPNGSAYRKQGIGACVSRVFLAYVMRISRVSGECWFMLVRTPRSYALYAY